MAFIRSVAFALLFYPGSLFFVLRTLLATVTNPARVPDRALDWARWHRLCCRTLLGIRSRIEGQLPTEPVLVAAKHQSMYETVELVLIVDRPVMVLKQELADLPLWGAAAQAYGAIPVDREGNAGALRRMLRAARAALASKRPVLIFPEGTRVAPGEQPPLKAGFAGLYAQLKLPVVPVAIDSGRLWPRKSFFKKPGIVTFRFGAPIPPGLPRAEIEARTHAAINALEHG